MRTLLRLVLLVALAAAATAVGGAVRPLAAQADVIRGRVVGPDSTPVANATVTATSMSGNVSRSTRTDRNGRFTITFPGGEGDYLVAFAAFGYAGKRFEVKRTVDQDILIADAKLQRTPALLDAMTVTAPRDKPARTDVAPDVGGTEQRVDQSNVPVDQLGDLAAMAASLPGVQLAPGADGTNGFSVLGLGADQNNTTLNGLSFGGANLPRDAGVFSSLVTSPYDVSRGGFSGAQFSLRSRPGSNFVQRSSSLNVDAPQMQWTDRAARALGQQYSNVSLGGSVSGPLRIDKAFYNIAYQATRRANDYQTLLNTSPLGLETMGVAADSAAHLVDILGRAHVPITAPGHTRFLQQQYNDAGSLFGSLDFAPPSSTSGQALNVTFNGSWNRQTPVGGFGVELPGHSGDRQGWNGGVQARHTTYFGFGILSEASLGVSASSNSSTPYLDLPSGSVRVASSFADGTSTLRAIGFGGSPSLDARQSTSTLGAIEQLSWFSENNKHRLKLTGEARREGFALDQATNTLGSFSYNSLADLDANRPSAFTRQLRARHRGASQVVGALSLGDSYKPNKDLQIVYGVRLDANRFLTDPAYNADVDRLFGTRNDATPSRVYASPRLGFSWTYGTEPQIASFEGAMRAPRAVVRGGIGMWQNTPGTPSIGQALDNTGLASAVQQLTCLGAATPVPDWSAYASDPSTVPGQCADGSTGSVFANGAPDVVLFARDYASQRSLRSNLQWNGPVLGNRFMTTVEGTYSLNLSQQSTVDLNFVPTRRFGLADEANRPVYVQPTSIFPATGTVATRDARLSPLFNRVQELRSDLRSDSRQLRVSLSPTTFSTSLSWSLSYVYSNVREQTRGFGGGNTVGNPLDVEWTRSSWDSRHQVVYSLGLNFADAVRVSWFGQLRSGRPYTPMIVGDVNGDGSSNDRAFVFDPRHTADATLAAAMDTLLASGSGAARACLLPQLGKLAERNSCQGPWSTTANLTVSFNPVKIRLPQRASLSFQVANPLGAADLMLHGENNLRGWGQSASPDGSLLYVRGFDPVANRYRYDVNRRFGATNPAVTAFRQPVTLTAMLRVDVGPTRERQMLTMQLDRGRTTAGTKMPEPMLRMMFGTGGIMNPLAQILRQADTLHLTGPQADSVASINRWYTIRVDSIWTPFAKYAAALPDRYDQGEVYERYRSSREATVDLLSALAPRVKAVLTDEQRRRLPAFVASYLDTRYLASIRSGTAGFGFSGPSMMSGFSPAMMGAVEGARTITITR